MERSHVKRYVAVQSEDYDQLGSMYESAIKAGYEAIG
jgi:hypothetical protein